MALPLSTRYVVLEWPTPGGRPELADTVVYSHLVDAQDTANMENAEAKRDSRPNTFTVHAVDMDVIDL